MTDEQARKIIVELRGTLDDPAVVDVFVGAYTRLMPTPASLPHPAARAIGEARLLDREEPRADAVAISTEAGVADGLLAVSSLSRAIGGGARPPHPAARLGRVPPPSLAGGPVALLAPPRPPQDTPGRHASGPAPA